MAHHECPYGWSKLEARWLRMTIWSKRWTDGHTNRPIQSGPAQMGGRTDGQLKMQNHILIIILLIHFTIAAADVGGERSRR